MSLRIRTATATCGCISARAARRCGFADRSTHQSFLRIIGKQLWAKCQSAKRRRMHFPPQQRGAFHAWTPEEIAQFEDAHPIGTTARLALALALYTGQRRSDLVLLGRQHITVNNGTDWLRFTQQKNKRNKPVHMEIPIAPELRVVMSATEMGELAFLKNGYNRPFTSNGFGNKFRDWCDAAGLPQCSAHGLRKAAAARLAELGCTEQEIMSITGHRTSKEIARYTKSANQKVRAERAIDKMSAKQSGQ